MYYLLLDTNIYLHCQLFDILPWDEITGKSGPFSILLPLQVLRELDSVKDRGEGAVNKKARRVSRKLGDILLDGIASKLPIIQCDVPSVDGFLSGFSTVIADDLILMSAIKFMEGKAADELIVVSRDIPLLLKAKQYGSCYVQMPEKYTLPCAGTEEDKEKKQLEKELQKYRNRSPKPYLAFEDRTNIIRIKRVKPRTAVSGNFASAEIGSFSFGRNRQN